MWLESDIQGHRKQAAFAPGLRAQSVQAYTIFPLNPACDEEELEISIRPLCTLDCCHLPTACTVSATLHRVLLVSLEGVRTSRRLGCREGHHSSHLCSIGVETKFHGDTVVGPIRRRERRGGGEGRSPHIIPFPTADFYLQPSSCSLPILERSIDLGDVNCNPALSPPSVILSPVSLLKPCFKVTIFSRNRKQYF